MENHPSSPPGDSVNQNLERLRNPYVQSQSSDNNNVEDEGTIGNRAITPPPPLPLYPDLRFLPTTIAAPITPPLMDPVAIALEPPRNLGNARNAGVVNECPEIAMLGSLGLFAMMTCPKAPYLFPRLLNLCDETLLVLIGKNVTFDSTTFLSLASDPAGLSNLRLLLRRSIAVRDLIFFAVCNNFFDLMTNKNGHYLIIPTLRAVDNPEKDILYALAADNAMNLATQEIGSVALEEFLQEMRGGVHRDRLVDLIAMNALWLAQDQYGTFVVQKVLRLQNPFATSKIARMLKGNFGRLSVQKMGSYVVEKCLESRYGRDMVFEEFVESEEWVRVAKDEYGNFVAQCALKILKGIGSLVYDELVNKLKPHYVEMLRGYGKGTLRTIQKLEEERGRKGYLTTF